MADQDQAAEISVGDADRLAKMLREWNTFKRAAAGDTVGQPHGIGIEVVAPTGLVMLTSAASVVIGSGGAFQWKYACTLVANPTGHKLSPTLATLASSQVALNTCEFANTSTKVMGITIYQSGAAQCGDAIGCKPLTDNFQNVPLPASLYWVWFQSGDPTNGYWAWHVSVPNQLTFNEDKNDSTR